MGLSLYHANITAEEFPHGATAQGGEDKSSGVPPPPPPTVVYFSGVFSNYTVLQRSPAAAVVYGTLFPNASARIPGAAVSCCAAAAGGGGGVGGGGGSECVHVIMASLAFLFFYVC